MRIRARLVACSWIRVAVPGAVHVCVRPRRKLRRRRLSCAARHGGGASQCAEGACCLHGQMPNGRAVAASSAGLLAALALAAVVVSHSGLAATELEKRGVVETLRNFQHEDDSLYGDGTFGSAEARPGKIARRMKLDAQAAAKTGAALPVSLLRMCRGVCGVCGGGGGGACCDPMVREPEVFLIIHCAAAPRQAVPGLATHAGDSKEVKKLFSYLAAESYTPQVSGAGRTQHGVCKEM